MTVVPNRHLLHLSSVEYPVKAILQRLLKEDHKVMGHHLLTNDFWLSETIKRAAFWIALSHQQEETIWIGFWLLKLRPKTNN